MGAVTAPGQSELSSGLQSRVFEVLSYENVVAECEASVNDVRHWTGHSWWLAFAEAYDYNVFLLSRATEAQWEPLDNGSKEVSRMTHFVVILISHGGHLVQRDDRDNCIAILHTTSTNQWTNESEMQGSRHWGHFELLCSLDGEVRWKASDPIIQQLEKGVEACERQAITLHHVRRVERAHNRQVEERNQSIQPGDVCLLRINKDIRKLPAIPSMPNGAAIVTMPVKVMKVVVRQKKRSGG